MGRLLAPAVFGLLIASSSPLLAEPIPVDEIKPVHRAAELIPAEAAVVVTLQHGDRHVADLRTLYHEHQLGDTAIGQLINGNPEIMQAKIGLIGLAGSVNQNAWQAVGNILGEDLTLALQPRPHDDPIVCAVSVLRDPAHADAFLEAVMTAVGITRNGRPDPDSTFTIGTTTVYQLGDEAFIARTDRCLAFANDRDSIIRMIKRDGAMLFESEDYTRAAEITPPRAMAWAYVDPDIARDALTNAIPEKLPNPVAGIVFGSWTHTLRNASATTAWIDRTPGGLALHVDASHDHDLPQHLRGFAPDALRTSPLNPGNLPGHLMTIELSRDWGAIIADREAYLSLSAAGDFVNFANSLSAIMGGMDFIDGVLDKIHGPVRLIATAPTHADDARPEPVLPSFALVAPITFDDADLFASRISSATLSALSIINIERSQKGERPMLVDLIDIEGRRGIVGRFTPPGGDSMNQPEPLGMEYNFAPCTAVIDDQLVIASSVDIVHAIARDVDGSTLEVGAHDPGDQLRIDGPELLSVLQLNEETLVINRMLEDDLAREEAEAEIDLIFKALAFIDGLSLDTSIDGSTVSAHLNLSFRQPD